MPVDYSRLRSLPARRLVRALEQDGFILKRQRGSHEATRIWTDGGLPRPYLSDTFRLGTLGSIVEMQARWSEADLVRLGLH